MNVCVHCARVYKNNTQNHNYFVLMEVGATSSFLDISDYFAMNFHAINFQRVGS